MCMYIVELCCGRSYFSRFLFMPGGRGNAYSISAAIAPVIKAAPSAMMVIIVALTPILAPSGIPFAAIPRDPGPMT